MNRKHIHGKRAQALYCRRHGIWNIVKLQIQKYLKIHVGYFAHEIRAVANIHLKPYLNPPQRPLEGSEHFQSGLSVRQIEIFDTAIAFLAGLMVIPAVFVFSGGDPKMLQSGPSLMFVILPKVFDTMHFGNAVGAAFFLLVIFAALSICLNMMLVSGLYIMLPQRSSSPLLFKHDRIFSQFALLEKQERPAAAIDLLTESFIEEFILLRYVISSDYDELLTRWGRGSRLYWMSSRLVYQNFISNDLNNNINQFKLRGLIRLAEVEWIKPMSRGFWMAQFITMDYYPGETIPIVNVWRAYLRAMLAPIPYENRSLREKNPFGFLVTNYSMSYVGTPDDPESYLNTAKDVRAELYPY